MERDEVLKAFDICAQNSGDYGNCEECPYNLNDDGFTATASQCRGRLIKDLHKIIKEEN